MKNPTWLFLFILLMALVVLACNEAKRTSKPISLTASKKITQFNDTTFWGNIWAIAVDHHTKYMANNNSSIYQVGPNMKLIDRFGKKGKGPGESTEISDMYYANDSLYVYDRAQAKVIVYDKENRVAREIGIKGATAFSFVVDAQSRMYLSTPNHTHLITVLDSHGHFIRAFGKNTVKKNSRHFLRNRCFLFIINKKLIAVSSSEPWIKVYNLKGGLIRKTEINPPGISDLIKEVKNQNMMHAKYSFAVSLSILFYDAAI
jgi:hypothetical protein